MFLKHIFMLTLLVVILTLQKKQVHQLFMVQLQSLLLKHILQKMAKNLK